MCHYFCTVNTAIVSQFSLWRSVTSIFFFNIRLAISNPSQTFQGESSWFTIPFFWIAGSNGIDKNGTTPWSIIIAVHWLHTIACNEGVRSLWNYVTSIHHQSLWLLNWDWPLKGNWYFRKIGNIFLSILVKTISQWHIAFWDYNSTMYSIPAVKSYSFT